MNRLKLIYIYIFTFGLFFAGCSEKDIATYNEEYPSVTFPWTGMGKRMYPGYNSLTLKFEKIYSFWSDPDHNKIVLDIPVQIVGDVRNYERKVNYTVDQDSTDVLDGSYKVLEAVVPAGEAYGKISIEVTKLDAMDTVSCKLELVLAASEDFEKGPKECTRMQLMWDNQLPMPQAGTFYYRTYNFLINAGQSMNLANYNYYSKNAHKAILAALGWPWESEKWPAYNRTDPDGVVFVTAAQANAYYDKLKKYLDDYEKENGAPLLHESGLAKGKPVTPRKF